MGSRECRGPIPCQQHLTYLEPTGLISGVQTAYLTGGSGSKKAMMFAAAILGIDRKDVKPHAVLKCLKAHLDPRPQEEPPLAIALCAQARACPALAPWESVCGALGRTKLSGGTLETFLCDGVWRAFRRLRLGCHRPRLSPWSAKTSGGNSLKSYPVWHNDESCTTYRLHDYLEAAAAADAVGEPRPQLDEFQAK